MTPGAVRGLATALALALWLGGAGCGQPAAPEVEDAWVRAGPPGASMLAGYMAVINPGGTPVVIEAVSSESFGRVELHRTVLEDGMARMRPEDSVTVPAGGRVDFEPNGRHLMLIDPVRPLSAGDAVTLRLRFADGRILETRAEVRTGAGAPPAGHRH